MIDFVIYGSIVGQSIHLQKLSMDLVALKEMQYFVHLFRFTVH